MILYFRQESASESGATQRRHLVKVYTIGWNKVECGETERGRNLDKWQVTKRQVL